MPRFNVYVTGNWNSAAPFATVRAQTSTIAKKSVAAAAGVDVLTLQAFEVVESYYDSLVKEFGDLSMVPAIRAGRALTNEDSAIVNKLAYKNPKGCEYGFVFQAVRTMDKGLKLEPFMDIPA